MKVIVGILLIVLIVAIVMLLSLVSYLLWDEVCDTYQKNRKRAIATKRLEDEMKRVCDEPQTVGYCNECKWYGDKQVCGRCRSRNLYTPKTEPQIERSEK